MRRLITRLTLFTALLLSALFVSCKYDLISEPTVIDNTKKNPADYVDAILPPASVTASHGTYRVINLQWTGIENAVQYQIFAATTPFDTFEQIAETAGTETEISIDYPSGTTMYFAVSAVNYYGTVSSKSNIVMGSTLAVPIITAIEPSADSQSVKISWWMDNCDENTYVNQIKFEITAYDSKKKLIPGCKSSAAKADREVELNGLSPKTDYYFQVEAILYNTDDSIADQKSEKSDLTSASTTHSVVPKAVNNFSVSAGESTEYVILSWNAPEGADYLDSASNTYKIHPVAFYVQRKLLGSSDDTFETIDKISITNGQASDYEHYSTPTMTYDCSTSSSDSTDHSELSITASSESPLEEYAQYIPDSIFVYKDTKASRGKQYSYRVVCYTDDTKKQITAKSSMSGIKSGWKISTAKFKANAEYEKNETKYTKITTTFAFEFNDFGLKTNYKYILTSTRTPFDSNTPDAEVFCKSSDSISGLQSIVFTDDLSDGNTFGYYQYKLYITPITVSTVPASPSEYYLVLESEGAITITDDTSKLPSINNLKIDDGYSDKYIVTWDNYNPNYSYTLSWIPYENGIAVNNKQGEMVIPKNEIVSINNDPEKVKYIHTDVISGDVRTYSLTADCGLKITETFKENEIPKPCKTLGTAEPTITDIDYSTITVTWPAVQMADSNDYDIEAKYYDDTSVTYDDTAASWGNLITNSNRDITHNEDYSLFTCKITNIKGYDNPTISGLPIKLKVIAKNSKDTTGTTATTTARTLGPALTQTKASTSLNKDYLEISWKDIEGASKYLVYRVQYSDKSENTISNNDIFIIEGTTVTTGQQQDVSGRTVVSYANGKYTLKDYQKDAVDAYGYHLTQDQIQWGLPYGYVVLPLKNDSNKDTFKFTNNTLTLESTSAVNYGTLTDTRTSTPGYGLNVTAAKSETSSSVLVTWEEPNNKELIPTVYRKRFNKNSEFDYGNSWEKVKSLSKNAVSYSDTLSKDDNAYSFVYAVQYSASTESDFVKSYRKKISEYDSKSPTEQKNKGYLLTLEDFSADYGGYDTTSTDSSYYQENVTWKPVWDYEERALGPDSFTIDIKNKNISSTANWSTLASYSCAGNVQSLSTKETYTDTTIDSITEGLTLKPTGLTAGTASNTSGILSVLRDAKHYYSVKLTRGQIVGRQADDESVYAYRQISDEELCKCVSIIIADALYQASIPESGISSWVDNYCDGYGESGKLQIGHEAWSNKVRWGFNNKDYIHQFISGGNSSDTSLLISDFILKSNTVEGGAACKGKTLYYLPENSISTKHNTSTEKKLSSYEKMLSIKVGKEGTTTSLFGAAPVGYPTTEWTVSININNSPILQSSKNKTDFINIFPYEIGITQPDKITKSTDNSSIPIYQSPWWN